MNQYLSTYRKDYTWPYMKTKEKRKQIATGGKHHENFCSCGVDPNILEVPKRYSVPSTAETHEWSRLGPMGALLDPKLYPAKTGPSPETEVTRYGQPDVYIRKLEEKHPYLYEVLPSKSEIETEQMNKFNFDRMQTTYQVDYGDKTPDYSTYHNRFATSGVDDPRLHLCVGFDPSSDSKYRARKRPRLQKDRDKETSKIKCGRKTKDLEETRLPEWKSEYEDVISKLGQAIMIANVHSAKRQVLPAWAASFL